MARTQSHRQVVDAARELGYVRFELSGGSHLRCYLPCGKLVVVAAEQRGDCRTWKNTVALLRRKAREGKI